MFELTIKEILNAVKGSLLSGDTKLFVQGISTDSRTIKKGELFFALKGNNFDGHRFVEDAFKKGASAAVVSSAFSLKPKAFSLIQVDDTLTALGDLAGYWRSQHPIPLIAVSGSCGKTSTKEMIGSILNTSHTVLKTKGNLNNLIGLPLTLFNINNIHDIAVVELGISEKGEMTKLVNICKPDIAVLTNIGPAHLETLEDIEGVAASKGEIFSSLKENSIAVINIDDPRIVNLAERIPQKKLTFSLKSGADVCLGYFSNRNGGMFAEFNIMGNSVKVGIKGWGIHTLSNALAAIAASAAAGAKEDDIINGFENYSPISRRNEVIKLDNNITLIDDTYNANPLSVEAALKSLSSFTANYTGLKSSPAVPRKIAVLGDMMELGDAAEESHIYIGRTLGVLGIDILFALGGFSKYIADGAVQSGMEPENIHIFTNKTDLASSLKQTMQEGDVILVKGSRATGMEEIVERLKA